MKLLLLYLSVVSFVVCRTELEIEQALYEIKETDTFGLNVVYAEHTIKFSKEVGITIPVVCPNYNCSNQDAIDTDCICNYADVTNCGILPDHCSNSCNMSLCNQ